MIISGIPYSAQLEGVYRPNEDYFIALYTPQANLGPFTKKYTSDGEVSGLGYIQGGQRMKGFVTGVGADGRPWISWSVNPIWPSSTIAARGCLIYTSTTMDAISVHDFGAEISSTLGPFEIVMPPATAETALLTARLYGT